MTRENYIFIQKDSEYAINDNSIKEVLSSKQKRFLNRLEFSNVVYDLFYSNQEYLKQKIIITTKENKKVRVDIHVLYDLDKKEYFINEKNSNILSRINDAVSNYNEELDNIKDVITTLKANLNINIAYEEETLIKLLNEYEYIFIKSFIKNYYEIQKETNTLLTLEQLVDTLDLF